MVYFRVILLTWKKYRDGKDNKVAVAVFKKLFSIADVYNIVNERGKICQSKCMN